jgi:hypothetical protein
MGRERRKTLGINVLATELGKDTRTIRRWVAERPDLRPVLRARRHGKQWRIECPPSSAGIESWVDEVRAATAAFSRNRSVDHNCGWAKRMGTGFGLRDVKRERELEVLCHALLLKRARRELGNEDEPPPAYCDETEASDFIWTCRKVCAHFNCEVKHAPMYWRSYLKAISDRNRAENELVLTWLHANKLFERARQLLPQGSGNLIALLGAPRANGSRRIKLYRAAPHWVAQEDVRARRVRFQRLYLPLLAIPSEPEIDSECARLEEIWPEPDYWDRARRQQEKDWQQKTLTEAIFTLLQDRTSITGQTLAPLLFRNPTVEQVWTLHQQHLQRQLNGLDVLCDAAEPRGRCSYGKRGISLREFRNRYTKVEMNKAVIAAKKMDATGSTDRAIPDPDQTAEIEWSEMTHLDTKLQRRPEEQPQQHLDTEWVNRHRRALEDSRAEIEIHKASLPPEQRQAVEQAFNDPFHDNDGQGPPSPNRGAKL